MARSKRMRRVLLGAASGTALASGGLWAGPAAAADPASTPATAKGAAQVEEVVVTAQRRSERLQDVAVAVTAITPKVLQANRYASVIDLNGLAPNLFIRSSSNGQSSIATTIRGLNSQPGFPGESGGVAFYLDGVYLANSYAQIFDLADTAQVEVLRGPQGTLFGRNATAGAISVTTRDPTGEFHVTQALSGGNYDQLRSKTHVELPQMGPFSANFTYLHSQIDGSVKNLGAGTVWNLAAARNSLPAAGRGTHDNDTFTSVSRLGDQDIDAFTGAVRFRPNDQLNVVYKFDYMHNTYTQDAAGLSYISPKAAAIIAGQPPGVVAPVLSPTRPDAINDNFAGPSHEVNYGHNLTATYRFNSVFTVKNILSYRVARVSFDANVDGLGGLLAGSYFNTPPYTPPFFNLPPNSPLLLNAVDDDYRYNQWSNETQLYATTQWFNLTSGYIIYVDHGKTLNLGQSNFPNGVVAFHIPSTHITGAGTPASPYVLPPCSASFLPVTQNVGCPGGYQTLSTFTHSEAVYSQAQIHLGPQLDFLIGGRETWDINSFGVQGETGGAAYSVAKGQAPTYLLGLNYKPTADMLVYGKLSKGYISGGVFSGRPYFPETSVSWEGGVKADWLNRTLRTNLAVFDVLYGSVQGYAFLPTGLPYVTNSGRARAKGLEFEGSWVPIEGVTLGNSVGYTNMRFTTQPIPLLQGIPTWTANFNAQYESHPLGWASGGRFTIRGDASYTSPVILSAGTVGVTPPAIVAATTVGDTWILNARMALEDIRLGNLMGSPTRWEIALWVRNLTDNKSLVGASPESVTGSQGSRYQPPRTFGVDLTADF